jgi:type II secretory pathway pseudopilin PulG
MIGGKIESQGFTVIEVIIVLGIAALMFISIASVFWGRQGQATFDQSINQAQAVLQQQVSNVENGYYPGAGNFYCTDTAPNGQPVLFSGSNNFGANSGCVFTGVAISLVNNSDPNQFAIYPLVGRQCAQNSVPPLCPYAVSVADSAPIALAASTSHPAYPDAGVFTTIEGGLTFNVGRLNSSKCGSNFGSIALVSNPTNIKQVDLYAICGSTMGTNSPNNFAAVQYIDNNLQTANPDTGIDICLESISSNESGKLSLYQGSAGLQVGLKGSVGNTTCT